MSQSNVKAICKLSDITNLEEVVKYNGNLFVVSDKDKSVDSLVYANDDFNNSDRVRSHFAKTTNIKFVDVRCCRIKNLK